MKMGNQRMELASKEEGATKVIMMKVKFDWNFSRITEEIVAHGNVDTTSIGETLGL